MYARNNALAEALQGFVVADPDPVHEKGTNVPMLVVANVLPQEATKASRGNPREPRRVLEFEDLSLRCLRYVDLASHVKQKKEMSTICRFTLHDGNSYAVFTLSVVPNNRVRFTCKESTVTFAPIFVVGSEVFQDEIWNMREPSQERAMATSAFQSVLEAIEERMQQRRNDRRQGR